MLRVIACICVSVCLAAILPAQDRPLPPREAPLRMTLPAGFRATLFAGEPDVVQPIAFTFDPRGRLWVVECLSYPKWTRDGTGKDRVTILEDVNGDGQFDRRTVFLDNGANLSGIAYGFGGVWLCSTPNLLFVPDRDGDDKPDGPPHVLLDGWSLEAKHNVFSALTWGPDGWLYGCNGILATSRVGKPGTPERDRIPLNCGVWRYHPTRHIFEPVAWGTTNPWGLDFDDYGQAFITNCVIHHLWHVVPGAHFQRMYGEDLNPHVYGLLPSIADHIHWAGGHWTTSRGGSGVHDSPGGGHAHAGCMIYLGNNWPAEYRHGVFLCNIHGSRVNHDRLERRGSTYVASHAKDVLLANDPWFRGIAIASGPDGGVYVSDWCDTGECHNYDVADVSNGRIFKVVHGRPQPWQGDLARLSEVELVRLQLHPDDWFVRQARRLLHERAAAGRLTAAAHAELVRILEDHPEVPRKLRALWALHVSNGLDVDRLQKLLDHSSEYLRAWAIRLLLDGPPPAPAVLDRLAELALRDPSPFVRLHLASGLQRLPLSQRLPIADGLLQHAADTADPYLPLMIWYGIEPVPVEHFQAATRLLVRAQLPLVRQYLTKRLLTLPGKTEAALTAVVGLLDATPDAAWQRDVLRGIQEALSGRRTMPKPDGWDRVYPRLAASSSPEVQHRADALAVLFGDQQAVAALCRRLLDQSASAAARHQALQTLLHAQRPELGPLLRELLADPSLRAAAIRALAAYADPQTPTLLLSLYATLAEAEKADVIQTLASRPIYALALLDAVGDGRVPRRDLSAFTARQLQALKDREVNDRLSKVWGTLRPPSAERKAREQKYRDQLTPDVLAGADLSRGRQLYTQVCASCHRLFGEGGDLGPELTGSQRISLDYLLENLLDPSAQVPREYQVVIFELKDGRVLNGIVRQETELAVTVQTLNETLVIPKADLENRTQSNLSMMPEGLLDKLSHDEVRDLIAYLASPRQVPLPKPK